MKKFIKICLIIAGVCGGVGILFCAIAFGMGGYHTAYQLANEGKLSHGKWHISTKGIYYGDDRADEDNQEAWEDADILDKETAAVTGEAVGANGIQYVYETAEIENMDIDMGAANIFFEEGERTDAIVVTLYNCKEEDYEGALGKTLHLEYNPHHQLFTSGTNRKIVVELPSGIRFDAVDIDMGAANVKFASDVIRCRVLQMDVGAANVKAESFEVEETLEVEVGAGNVEICGGSYEAIEITCGMGNFNMQGAVSGDIKAECGMGNMELYLEGNPDAYDYNLSCGAGRTVVNGVKYSGIAGEHQIKNEGAAGTADIECGMGNVTFAME